MACSVAMPQVSITDPAGLWFLLFLKKIEQLSGDLRHWIPELPNVQSGRVARREIGACLSGSLNVTVCSITNNNFRELEVWLLRMSCSWPPFSKIE
jgi:hypothetical protein